MQEYARRMHPEIFGDATDSTIFVKDTVTVNRGQKRKRGKRGLVSTLRFLTIAMGEKGYQKRALFSLSSFEQQHTDERSALQASSSTAKTEESASL